MSVVRGDPRGTLAELGVRPSRFRGQNFLIDQRVADRQIEYAHLGPEETVLEIGPGLGVLTERLVDRARRVFAIESDRRFAAYLRRIFPQVDVLEGDALRLEWPAFDVLVSNLPYKISSPVTFRLLGVPFARAILMYQYEFARRMVALPGTADYSRLTVGVYTRARCEILERVPRSAFHPQPKVDSAIVRLEARVPPFPIVDPALFDAVVECLFQHRRKTIENGLRLGRHSLGELGERFDRAILGVPYRSRRVGELRPEQIGEIADAIVRAKD
jgi:16S rRNA (adenine1518-N6/adenine1519-N6)-dimethyltransferase